MKQLQHFLFIIILVGCNNKSKLNNKINMKISFEVIPEDYERNLYTVNWTDTLGKKEGYIDNKFTKRPQEVWCIITNKKQDTLGYYKGLSTVQTYASFQTKDTTITLNFIIGLNMFNNKFDTIQNMADYEKTVNNYLKSHRLPLKFEPIYINLNTDLRKQFNLELKER